MNTNDRRLFSFVITGLAIPAMALFLIGAFTTGCSSTAGSTNTTSITNIVTPARVESVAALGSYLGAKKAIADGHQAELERALAALEVLQASDTRDLTAVAAALGAAGINFMETPEGVLAVGVVTSFQDLWSPSGQQVLDSEYAKAILTGSVRGVKLALNVQKQKAIGGPDVALDTLRGEARATRPAR